MQKVRLTILIVAAVVLLGVAVPAQAREQSGLVVSKSTPTATGHYPGFGPFQMNPLPTSLEVGDLTVTPSMCRQLTSCDVIALDLQTWTAPLTECPGPGICAIGPHLEVRLSWVPGTDFDDLDLYLFENGVDATTPIVDSTARGCCSTSLFAGHVPSGRSQLVVNNWVGNPAAYDLTATYRPYSGL